MTKTIIVYGTQMCPWCHKMTDWLKENGIDFEYIDVGNAGISNTGTNDDSVRIWAGGDYITDGSNNLPFSVTQDGTMTATKANITGEITTQKNNNDMYLNIKNNQIL
ncbi:glutaredoxin, partial [Candidatus Pacearchaeota archaeon]|nr:glutaredoxin [Candidatus Pacearchaeota archaeon]